MAKHLTPDESEQKILVEFVSNLENTFHVNLHNLFQESDYLTVAYHAYYKDKDKYIRNDVILIDFNFSNQEPRVALNTNTVFWNGRLKYSVDIHENKTYYRFWYEGQSKYGGWSSGTGYDENSNGWYKIVNLNEFDWYQERKQP